MELLAIQAQQGRSMDRAVLTLFMAGAVRPSGCPDNSPLFRTYETAVRRAFRREIDNGEPQLLHIADAITDEGEPDETQIDEAFRRAAQASANRRTRRLHKQYEAAAELAGFGQMPHDHLLDVGERAWLTAAGVLDMDELAQKDELEENLSLWSNGFVPLDLQIFAAPPCKVCTSRTQRVPTSRQGRHDILKSACFCVLDRARAIGGATTMAVGLLRDRALRSTPEEDEYAHGAVMLFSHTIFRYLLRDPIKVWPGDPESIVPATLFFLYHCNWLRSGAAALDTLARWRMPDVPDVVEVSELFRDHAGTALTRTSEGVSALLMADGTVAAIKMLATKKSLHEG
ncbi:hypothetical protein [Nocardia niigatensis]|uniref:hypothetical protein n=1 Tax=Nocardia niigatensis TaxID=209249 RepID=UPI0006860E84|nr:hypothetical protein [Nocardia niigatensis]